MAASLAAGEWLRAPTSGWAAAAGVCCGLAAVIGLGRKPRRPVPALLAGAAGLLLGVSHARLADLNHDWPAIREARVVKASNRMAEELREARQLTDSLAARAVAVAGLPREAGFDALAALVPREGLEAGVAVLDSTGAPRMWAGRFRLAPEAVGDSLGARLTPYYAVLEARRHAGAGRIAVASVLLAAGGAVPDADRSLAARYEEGTAVALRILPARLAPDSSDVFDYTERTSTGEERTLFSVQFEPDEQQESIEAERTAGGRRVAWAVLLALVAGIFFAPPGAGRILVLAGALGFTLRAPLGGLLGIEPLFDPRIFSDPILGPLSSSAAPLGLAGALLVVFGVMMWRRGLPRTVAGAVAAFALIIGAPYLISALGNGLAPPTTGTPTAIWLIWEVTLFLAAAGLITVAAALVRGPHSTKGRWVAPVAGAVLGVLAAAVGVWVWNARYGWPDWYTFLWTPALVLVLWPSDRRAVIAGIAVVAGSASALVTWGAEVEDRMAAARRDIAALGDAPDPAGEVVLRTFAAGLARVPPPASAPELFALWRSSELGRDGRPAVLGVWQQDGTPRATLELEQLDLPFDVLGAIVRSFPPDEQQRLFSLRREPAMHHLLLERYDSATVLLVAIGPRSSLVPPTRLGRLLTPGSNQRPPYQLTLAPAPSRRPPDQGLALWRRQGWTARGERVIEVAGIPREVYGVVELGRPGSLAVRGVLVIALNAALFAALWTVAILLGGEVPLRPAWLPRLRSYQARLGAALTVFFLAPTVGLATWGLRHLQTELRHGRDRIIEWTLRDAVPPSGAIPADPAAARGELIEESRKIDADLALYRNGRLVAESSEGVLTALGFLAPFTDPAAYRRVAMRGDAVAMVDGPSESVPLRVGYQSVLLSDLTPGILASPSPVGDPILSERQRDLAYVLLLATLAGIAASLMAARRAARALSRPVSDLRHAAQAFGRGESLPPPVEPPPAEFRPVFAAFEKMAADVRAAQEGQERVARIVAWAEMASQVAHEIKNPLTPLRLGVQHLRRVHEDRHAPLGPVMEETTRRILAEIDRLDRIARSFSRFGVPASAGGPLEAVSLSDVAREVADLYRIGGDGAAVEVVVDGVEPAAARSDEVREALMNLVENARNAEARIIRMLVRGPTLTVIDDGCGIPPEVLPRVFEPRFSTNTSGSGLGLAIVKRLVESWGGQLTLESEVGKGTTVRLDLRPADSLTKADDSAEPEAPASH